MSEPKPQRSARRRRRRSARRQSPQPAEAAEFVDPTPAPAAPAPTAPAVAPGSDASPSPRKRRPSRDAGTERGLRDLVGAGRSQVGVSGSLRARDVNRPTDEDIAEAERTVSVVRRNWRPPSNS